MHYTCIPKYIFLIISAELVLNWINQTSWKKSLIPEAQPDMKITDLTFEIFENEAQIFRKA